MYLPEGQGERHEAFLRADQPHALMITNHGIHQWNVQPGLPDTGGQNVFVNQFTGALVNVGFRVTIANRGGYDDPWTGGRRMGYDYRDVHQRIVYLEDGDPRFVRKEDMAAHVPQLAGFLRQVLDDEGTPIDLIVSHYWDGANVATELNASLASRKPHVWVPHSLGTLKRRNMPPSRWSDLRIDERIAIERELLKEIDAAAATSSTIRQELCEEYEYSGPVLFLPPCVDPTRLYPREVSRDDPFWDFLLQHLRLSKRELRQSRLITEVGRTDKTKRKDLVIDAFAGILAKHPDSVLAITIDRQHPLSGTLLEKIREYGIEDRTAVLGSIWDQLPALYASTGVYITPSEMEGFGMAIQEAAASGAPAIASDLVPFAVEYLLGDQARRKTVGNATILIGEAAIVAPAGETQAFTEALDLLLSDDALRARMAEAAHRRTVPYFTWPGMVDRFLAELNEQLGKLPRDPQDDSNRSCAP